MLYGGYSKGDSGALQLVRTVCKAVQAKGCEKSGRAVPDDLIGKVIHYCYGHDGKPGWSEGIVIGTHGKNSKEPDYLIR